MKNIQIFIARGSNKQNIHLILNAYKFKVCQISLKGLKNITLENKNNKEVESSCGAMTI